MNVAVLTLTRDRLDYTQHCFARLEELAGCDYDHFVLDQKSTDETRGFLVDWKYAAPERRALVFPDENLGICRGLNRLLDSLPRRYDVIVKIDNDCEIVTPDTLLACAETALDHRVLCSPRIDGLRHPPLPHGELEVGTRLLQRTSIIGGIFLAAPASLYFGEDYRHDEGNPLWGGDDVNLCAWWSNQGRELGYLDGYVANHYETTDGQHERYPDYFGRRVQEGGPE